MIPIINMELGEIIFGGVGSGLCGMIVFVIIAIFVAGLMVGRTPEYLGKKIEAKEVKMAMLAILCLPLVMLGGTAIALGVPSAVSATNNSTARMASPKSSTRSPRSPPTTALHSQASPPTRCSTTCCWRFGMLIGRFFVIVPAMAIAGSLAMQRKRFPLRPEPSRPPAASSLACLVGVILIVGGLTFFPALALGPIVEHLATIVAGKQF